LLPHYDPALINGKVRRQPELERHGEVISSKEMTMFDMHTHPKPEAFEYTRGVIGSAVACGLLLAGLVVADKLLWRDPWAAQTYYYDQHRWNPNG
jgi:hypothetical protein